MPRAYITSRAGLKSEVTATAAGRWNPDIRAAADSEKEVSISILAPISEDFMGEGVSSKRISGALRNARGSDVVVNINSPGGDYFEGLAIYNMLREYEGKVTVRVLGMATSAALIIAMAGDVI